MNKVLELILKDENIDLGFKKVIKPVATIKNIDIMNSGKEKVVSYSINELGKSYYWEVFRVSEDTTLEEINARVEKEVSEITQKDIDNYREFLNDSERWGF